MSLDDCDIILERYKNNFRNFNIEFNSIQGRYENTPIEYGTCFLKNVKDDQLNNLENTTVNCVYKVYDHSNTEKYFIKVQLEKEADSLQEEADILLILNTKTTLCPTLISKFIVGLQVDKNNTYSICKFKVKPMKLRPCIVTTAYTDIKDFFEIFNNTMQDITTLGSSFFEKLNVFCC